MSSMVEIFDTTLRDGSQGEGVNFSQKEKLRLILELDAFGVDYIEVGFPGSNDKDARFFEKARALELSHARLVAFGMTRRPGVATVDDVGLLALVNAGTPVVTIVGKADASQVKSVLRTSLEENLLMVTESVAFLKAQSHVERVFFDAEHFFDGYHHDPEYALRVLRAAAEGGADCLVLCDTNGGSLPDLVIEAVVAADAVGLPLGIHAHNDCELAVANSLAAVAHGVRQVQGTINGLGERCGNADLCSVVANLALKYPAYRIAAAAKLKRLRHVSLAVYDAANLLPRANQPYVGSSSFAHKAGLHVNGMAKDDLSYEHVDPEAVGGRRRILVSELAGVTNVDVKLRELGLELSRDQVGEVLAEVKRLADEGVDLEGADASLFLLACRTVNNYWPWFRVKDSTYHDRHVSRDQSAPREGRGGQVNEVPPKDAMATVKGWLDHIEPGVLWDEGDGHEFHTVAEGSGPVDAFDAALRKGLLTYSPQRAGRMSLLQINLVDYRVRVLEEVPTGKKPRTKKLSPKGQGGTAAQVRVLVTYTDGKRTWTTLGVDQNVVRASFKAVEEAYAYKALVTELDENLTVPLPPISRNDLSRSYKGQALVLGG
jgi:2-isopropylmalate synthase